MTTILIPSYEPDERLTNLVRDLNRQGLNKIVVVDDGSGEKYDDIFADVGTRGCTVLKHAANQGKGRALKSGFGYIRDCGTADDVVCADSDGQHLPDDILRIAGAVAERPNEIVLGSRHFTGNVPMRSKIGNLATRKVYAMSTGVSLTDTQTGLRGYSAGMLDWLCRIPGERFEYEMNMLLEAPGAGHAIHEIPIETVYLENNKSSHFRPIADSLKIYLPFLKFSTSSLIAGLIDFVLLFALTWLNAGLLLAVVASRVCSSIFNYSVNRKYVFTDGKAAIRKSMPRYFALVLLIVALNYGFLYLLHEIAGIPLIFSKLMTEGILFALSYWSQRQFVY